MRFSLGLLPRISLALAVVGLVPLLLLTSKLVGESRTALTDQVLQTHALASRTAADRIEAFVSPIMNRAVDLAENPVLNASPGSPEGTALLSASLQGLNDAIGIQVRNSAGAIVAGVGVREMGAVVAEVLKSPTEDRVSIALQDKPYVRVREPLHFAQGFVEIVSHADKLPALLSAEELGEEADVGIFDRLGRRLATTESSSAGFPSALIEAGKGGKIGAAARYPTAQGEVLGAVAPIASLGWFVASRQSTKFAETVSVRLRNQSAVALGIALGLMALMGFGAYATLVKPIRSVVAIQERLLAVDGQATQAIARARTAGTELDQIGASLKILEQRMHDQEVLGQVFLGRYQVLKVLGEGAMGCVFRGYDPKLQRHVALKTIRLGIGQDEDQAILASKLLHEATLVAQFNHPNIVDVYDVEESREGAFVAMELIEGCTLASRIERGPRLRVDQVVPLGAMVARALEAAHVRNIIHHDVKPANILLSHDGAVKVVDFGIAELASLQKHDSEIWGTPGYLPPEAIRGEGYDARGDIFALGAVLYECLSGGRPAVEGDTPAETMKNTAREVRPLRGLAPDVPEFVEDLIHQMLAKDKTHRTADAGRIADILEKMAAQHGWKWTAESARRAA